MVRHRWEWIGGKRVWAEIAPTECPNGHPGPLGASWGPCPECGQMGRQWRCLAEGCGEHLFDDEHEHRRPMGE